MDKIPQTNPPTEALMDKITQTTPSTEILTKVPKQLTNRKRILTILGGIPFIILAVVGIYIIYDNIASKDEDGTQMQTPGEMQNIPNGGDQIQVRENDSDYEIFAGGEEGWFENGQDADITLSSYGFNNTGGPLNFNHQKGIATDGERLLLADTRNNRILIWNSLPESNVEPDIVLGQENFTENDPGDGLNKLRWPVGVSTNGEKVVVVDTNNDRILIWNTFPTQNGQSADITLETPELNFNDQNGIKWPWAVHIEGEKLIVTNTQGKSVFIWNSIPTSNSSPDLILQNEDFGTPRTIITDGTRLSIGDHNAYSDKAGNFVWNSFPTTSNAPYDYFITDPGSMGTGMSDPHGAFMYGAFTPEGKYIVFDGQINIWDSFPESEDIAPDLVVGSKGSGDKLHFMGGDGSGVAYVDGKLFLSSSNDNFVAVYNELPTSQTQMPDFVIGSPDVNTNTLRRDFLITNPMLVTDGESLFVVSDFERKLYVWKNLPNESTAEPDYIYDNVRGWDIALWGETLAVADQESVTIWEDQLPLGDLPNKTFSGKIGSAELKNLKGVALDDKYFYLSDEQQNAVYIWEGIPDENDNPKFTLDLEGPQRIYSDGEYLAVILMNQHQVNIYSVNELSTNAQPTGTIGGMNTPGQARLFNLPQNVLVYNNHIFIADTGFNQIKGWENIADALSGAEPDVILGAENMDEIKAGTGKDKLMMPAGMTYDGVNLWVGEFKFSGRILRFPPTVAKPQ